MAELNKVSKIWPMVKLMFDLFYFAAQLSSLSLKMVRSAARFAPNSPRPDDGLVHGGPRLGGTRFNGKARGLILMLFVC